MLTRGIPETVDEADSIITRIAAQTPNSQQPSHWPHSQIVALAQYVQHLEQRIRTLEGNTTSTTTEPAKRRPGRPAKATTEAGNAIRDLIAVE